MALIAGTPSDVPVVRTPAAPATGWDSDTTDAELIMAAHEDTGRFAAIYDRHAHLLYGYAYRRIGAAAEDVVAETFLAAFQNKHRYDPRYPDARPWLFGILTRKLAAHRRAETIRYRALAAAGTGTQRPDDTVADLVTDRVTAGSARQPLAAALARLSQGDRDVLLLIAWGQLSYDEVALALNIPRGTVGSRLNRARRQVRQALGGIDPTHLTEETR